MKKGLLLFICLSVISLFAVNNAFQFPRQNEDAFNPVKGKGKAAGEPLCLECHSDLIEKKVQHTPAKEGCENCHGVKVADHPEKVAKGLFLTEKVPGLCFLCHDDIKKEIDPTGHVHAAVNEKKFCMNCHSPHSSDEKKLLSGNKKELCLGCHSKDKDANGKKQTNFRQLLATAKVVHPALIGGCNACHKPHASPENFLLISAYPAGQYAAGEKDNYAVCWECHDSDLLDLEKTATSTNFRDGERNLHYLHIKGPKGRSCSVCHNMHATKNARLIVEKVPFGEWNMPMNYVAADSGGSCAPGCHGPEKYRR
jgi:predicted CXXCH cytochrome family protein